MKFGKFLFCIILILSLSALDLNLLNNFNVNASTRFENTLLNLENNKLAKTVIGNSFSVADIVC